MSESPNIPTDDELGQIRGDMAAKEARWGQPDEDPTLKGVLAELGRIADALEAQVRPTACDERHTTGAKCVLDDRHVGHHVTADGRYHWLDEE